MNPADAAKLPACLHGQQHQVCKPPALTPAHASAANCPATGMQIVDQARPPAPSPSTADACTYSSAALDPATGMQISLPMTMNPDGSYSLPPGGMMADPSQPPQPYLPPYAQAQAATEEGGEGTQSQPDAGKLSLQSAKGLCG